MINKIRIFVIAKMLALRRRIHILVYKDFNPYPKIKNNIYLSPSEIISNNLKFLDRKLNDQYKTTPSKLWKNKARKQLLELLSINNNLYCKEVFREESTYKKVYSRNRLYLEFSKNRHAPIDIIIKKKISNYKGIIICMQGTNSGAHLNLGEIKMPADIYKVSNGSSLALQAANEGFIAVSFERIGYGERRETKLNKANLAPNIDFAFHSLLIGKTCLGETVSELILLVKWLKNTYKGHSLWLKGYSEAGTVAITAAAVDKNIDGIAVGGCVGLTKDTLLKRGAGGLNDIPNLLTCFEQDVIISLISPRPCIIVAGINDHIWPYKFAEKTLITPKDVYKKDHSNNNLVLIKGKDGHTYYPNLMWPIISKLYNRKT